MPQAAKTASWTLAASRFDLMVIAATVGCALATLWFASEPVTGSKRLFFLGVAWPVVGVAWALSVAVAAQRSASRFGALLLLVGAVATFTGLIPALFVFVYGPGIAVLAAVPAVALLGMIFAVERPRRAAWLVAPAIVVFSAGVALSGLPRAARFAIAEPAITAYSVQLLQRVQHADIVEAGPVTLGGIGVRRANVRGGCVHLVTAHVGFLGGSPAGLAYCPTGVQSARREYEPFSGAWFRWWNTTAFD